jgi:methyl-accepting chemotaxis protein
MKIRAKLVLLILGIVALFGAASTAYFLLLSPVNQMEREKTYYSRLADAIKTEQIALNRIPFGLIAKTSEAFDAAVKKVDAAFQDLDHIKLLSTINADAKKSTEIIAGLKTLNEKRLQRLQSDYQALEDSSKAVFLYLDQVSFSRLYTDKFRADQNSLVASALSELPTLMVDIDMMQNSLVASINSISERYAIIDASIASARSKALATAVIIVAAIIALTILGALVFANGIAKSVIGIERNIALLKEGDLSERAQLSTRDEIGVLAGNLNLFLDAFSHSILNIKSISEANIEAKDRLIEAANEATSSTTQIEANARSIEGQVQSLDGRIEQSSGSIGKILAGIAGLDAQIDGQSAMVEEATASVTQMLSSLANMSRLTERNRVSAGQLVQEAEKGRSVFETAFTKIGEIPQNIGTIRDMAAVIQNIASRTNLLAMNAAIEAAHAGEAGRGFAVVADEIRKLSEASTRSSRDIASSISAIVKTIEEASMANAGTNQAFAAIDARIREVSRAMTEIFESIKEFQTGSEQILAAMTELQDRSLSVQAGSRAMDDGSKEIKTMMEDVGRISSEVASNIAEIAKGVEDIGASIRVVASLADNVGSGSARLDGEVGFFKTGPADPAQAGAGARES